MNMKHKLTRVEKRRLNKAKHVKSQHWTLATYRRMVAAGRDAAYLNAHGATAEQIATLIFHDPGNAFIPTMKDREFVIDCMASNLTHTRAHALFLSFSGTSIAIETFRKKFKREIEEGVDRLVVDSARVIRRSIKAQEARSAKFVLETKGGWNKTTQLANPGGLPLTAPVINVKFVDPPVKLKKPSKPVKKDK